MMTFTAKFGLRKACYFFFLLLAFTLLSAYSFTDSEKKSKDDYQSKILQNEKDLLKDKSPTHAYVLLQGSQSIGLLNLVSGEFEKTIPLDFLAKILAVSPDGKALFLSDISKNILYKIEIQSGDLKQIVAPKETPHQLLILPQEELAYALYPDSCDIVCLNFKSNSFSTWLSLTEVPHHIVFSQLKNEFFISFKHSSEIVKIDLATSTIFPFISLSNAIQELKVSADDQALYTFLENDNRFEIIDISSLKSETISYSFTHFFDKQKFANRLTLLAKTNALLIAEEKGYEIFAFDFKANHLQEIIQFDYPISSIEFVPEPKLNVSFKAEGLNAGLETLFDASETKSHKEGQIFYQWDFGDGQTALSENSFIEHRYALPGNYHVILTAKQEIKQQESQPLQVISDEMTSFIELGQNQHIVSIPALSPNFENNPLDNAITVDSVKKSPILKNQLGLTPTTTTLTNTPNSSTYGQAVTLTATVNPLAATGTVTFYDGSTSLGTANLSGGTATSSVSTLSVGSHSLTAIYSGDATYATSTSTPANTQIVSQATPTVTISSNPSSSTYGQTVNLTANVSPLGATGTVTFLNGSTSLGTANLSSGTATLSVSTLSVGSHSLIATYNGNANYSSASSSPITQMVNKATPTVGVMSSLNPSSYSNPVTFTATVTAPYPGVPTGTVQFYDNGVAIGTSQTLSQLTTSSAQTTYTLNTLNGGNHTITATYGGDSNFNTQTGSLNSNPQVVNLASTSTTFLSTSQSPTEYGQPFSLQAIVVGSPSSPPLSPGGTVSFYACPSTTTCPPSSATLLGTSSLTATPNTNTSSANFNYSDFLPIGNYNFYAVYSGDTNYITSTSSNIPHTISQTLTTSVTTYVDNCSNGTNSNVTLTTTVTSNSPGTGTPTGDVYFYDGVDLLGIATLTSNSNGAAVLTKNLSVGTHSITAIYKGNVDYATSTAPAISVVTTIDSTTTTLNLNGSNPSNFGESLTFTATVSPGCEGDGNTPTGTVNFTAQSTSTSTSTIIGTVTLSPGSGNSATASLTICNLYPDTYNITVTYAGDSNFSGSTNNPPLSQTIVGPLDTTTNIISSSQNPVAICPDKTVFTAQVLASTNPPCPNLVVNGGTVSFTIDSTTYGPYNVVNGIATSDPICVSSTPGSYNIVATYSGLGAGTIFYSSASQPFSQCVTPYDTVTSLVITNNNPGSPSVTLTATVTALGSGPFPNFSTSGTVSFYEGTTLIETLNVPEGSNTTFSISITAPCVSCSTVTAIYSGENCVNFDTSQDTVPTSSINAQVTSVSVGGTPPYYTCQPITLQATVFAGCSTANCSPTGIVAFFNGDYSLGSAVIDDSGLATLVVPSLAVGSYSISATYAGDSSYESASSTTSAPLTIQKPTTTMNFVIVPDESTGAVANYGETIIFGANVTSSSGSTPTSGSVIFSDENGIFATIQINAKGMASYSTNLRDGGTHNFTATYDPDCCSIGDGCFSGSSATISNYLIQRVLPNFALSLSPQTVEFGDVISLSTTISSYSVGIPTGFVTFYCGSTQLGTAQIVNNVANLRVSNYLSHVDIPTGPNVIFWAEYMGDIDFLPTNSNYFSETINQAPVTVNLYSASSNPSFHGETINLTASVRSLYNIPTDSGNNPIDIPPTGTITFVVDGVSQTPATLTNGVATLAISNLSAGAHTIVANYNGDSNFLINHSLTYTQQVEKIGTSIAVTSTSNPSTYNSSSTLTVNVNPLITGYGTPTGNVKITYGQNVTQTSALAANGTATFNLANLPAGDNNITITYSGDGTYNVSNTDYNQIVNPATTNTTSSTTPNNLIYGQVFNLNATVTSSAGTPTGAVYFSEGGVTLGVGNLVSGSTSIILNNLSVGNHTITVTYPGLGNFAASSSSTSFTISQASTTVLLQTSGNDSVYGKTTTFTATVIPTLPGAGTPTGTVSFVIDGGSPILVNLVNGVATFPDSSLTAGTHTIVATYTGDINFNTSPPASLSQTIIPNSTLTQVSSSINPAAAGSNISLNVNVLPTNNQGPIPNGGTVNVYDGSNPTPIAMSNLTNGAAIIALPTTLSVGTHSLTITYTDDVDSNFSPSSTYFDQIINTTPTNTSLSINPASSTYGQDVTLTATVTNPSTTFSGVPTGEVNFIANGRVVGIGTLNSTSASTAQASITLSSLPVGTYPITTQYLGDNNFDSSSSGSTTFTVSQASTTVSLQTSGNDSVYGNTTTFTATVIPTLPGAGTPTGTVSFVIDGGSPIPVNLVNGVAIFSDSSLTAGPHTIVATYNGDGNFNASLPSSLSQTIIPNSTLTQVSSSINPAAAGSNISLNVNVLPTNNQGPIPNGGTVNVYDGSNPTPIATSNLTNGAAIIALPTTLSVGTHSLTITYTGGVGSNFSSSSIYFDQIINTTPTNTSLSINPASSTYGQDVTLTATVTNPSTTFSGVPTGEVNFIANGRVVGIGTLNSTSASTAQASITLSSLPVGTYPITTQYLGDNNFDSSSSGSTTFTVNQASTTVSLQTSGNDSVYGNTTTFTATVIPTLPGAGTPTGTVSFKVDGGSAISVNLVNGVATFSDSSLTAGPHTIVATYNGDSNFNASLPSSLSQTIIPNSTLTQVSSSLNPAAAGSNISLNVNVLSTNSQDPIPDGGTVNVYDGSNPTPIATSNLTNGAAIIALPTTLSVGTHALTITYTDGVDSNFSASSTYFDQIINPGTTTTALSLSSPSSAYGQNLTLTATVTDNGSSAIVPTGEVNFISNNMVIGTGILIPASGNSAQASITLGNLAVGTYSITAQYLGDINFSSSFSVSSPETINAANTLTSIILNTPNPSQFNEPVIFVATTIPNPQQPGSSVVDKPTGTVSFYDNGVFLGTAPTNGIAVFETDQLTVSSPSAHNITAIYSGDANYQTSTSTSVQQIVTNTAQTSTTRTAITSTPNPSNYGCPVDFTITVTPLIIPSPPPPTGPTGTVYLYLGSEPLTPIGLTLDPITGQASVTIPSPGSPLLPAGMLEIVAIYSGDAYYSASTATYNQTVKSIPVNLTLNSSVNPSLVNQYLTLHAALSADPGCFSLANIVPTGTVSFYDGPLLLGTSLINAAGLASLTVNDLTIGSHTLTAVYNPDTNFNTASSNLQQNVLCLPTETQMLNVYPNPVVQGNELLFIVGVSTIANENITVRTGTPVGTVTFYDTFNGFGPSAIGTVSLSNGIALLNVSNLTSGTHNITAVYSGSTNFCSSVLAAPGYQQTVLEPVLPSNLLLTSSLNPSEYGQQVIFTTTITDPSHLGTPTGTVTFFDGTEAIGTVVLVNGVAQLPVSDLSIGDHPITAVYSGNSNYDPETSTVYNQIVAPSSYPLAPHDFKGCQVVNKYLNFNDRVNILTWEPPQGNHDIVHYEIYRDAKLKHQIGLVKNNCPYRFEDGNRKKGRTYKYYIVSVNRDHKKSPAVYTKVVPKNKSKGKRK